MVPIPYMECRNLVSVNRLLWSPYLIWNAGTLYLSMTIMVPQTLYGMVGNLVTINDLWSPIPYMDGRDLIISMTCDPP